MHIPRKDQQNFFYQLSYSGNITDALEEPNDEETETEEFEEKTED